MHRRWCSSGLETSLRATCRETGVDIDMKLGVSVILSGDSLLQMFCSICFTASLHPNWWWDIHWKRLCRRTSVSTLPERPAKSRKSSASRAPMQWPMMCAKLRGNGTVHGGNPGDHHLLSANHLKPYETPMEKLDLLLFNWCRVSSSTVWSWRDTFTKICLLEE